MASACTGWAAEHFERLPGDGVDRLISPNVPSAGDRVPRLGEFDASKLSYMEVIQK